MLFQAFRMAMGSLRTNKLRTALTLLGMVIGMFAIITSVTAVRVIEVYFEESLNFLGSSSFSITRDVSVGTNEYRNRMPITYEQVERLEERVQMPLVISPEQYFAQTSVRFQGRETDPDVLLLGSDEDYLLGFGFDIAQGRGLTAEDVRYGRPVVMLGASVASELFTAVNPIGREIRIHGHPYRVVGVLNEKGSFLGWDWDNRVVAPITTMFTVYGGSSRDIGSVSVRTTRVQDMVPAMDHVIGHLRAIRKVKPGDPNDFELETNESVQQTFEQFTRVLTTGGVAIGLISLIAAGIGIMNIMLVSVTERTREIGIRKSVGARRRDIMRQFLFEAFFLCLLGGTIGSFSGMLFGNLTAVYFNISAAFPLDWAIYGLLAVTLMAVVFGGYPALRGARLDPIEALRYE